MTEASPFIFISYSRADRNYATGLAKAFKEHGISVWMDDSIDHGAAWVKAIWHHLKSCQAFVLIMTPRALDSHWVECELITALEKRKQIFPVLLEDERWYNVANIQYADVRDGSLPPNSFFERVKAHISAARSSAVDPSVDLKLAHTQENGGESSDENEFEALLKLKEQDNLKWAGDWFVNVGEGDNRTWEDCVQYGFLSAGQGAVYSSGLRKLKVGSTVYAYMAGLGYVGLGKVIQKAVPIASFTVGKENLPLLSMPLKAEKPDDNSDNPELSEWVVGVKWLKTFPKENPQRFVGAFANPNVVCKLRNRKTLVFLREKFGWAGDWFVNVGEGMGHRNWEDCVRYGFISAGQKTYLTAAMRKLEAGHTIYAYIGGYGYVGFGEVIEEAVPIKSFTVNDTPLLSMALRAKNLSENADNPELSEWVARIKWLKTYKREGAQWFTGAFAHKGTLCKLRQQQTLDFLHAEFGGFNDEE